MNDFIKQTEEKYPISMDYQYTLNDTESISTVDVKAYTMAGVDSTSTLIDSSEVDGDICKAVVKAGTSGVKYKITFKATTDEGNTYEEDVFMKVQNV